MLAVIIPTYKEKENVGKIVPLIFSIITNSKIIIVDDSPISDGTEKEVKDLQRKYKNLQLIKRNKKDGRGSAVIEGLKSAYDNKDIDAFIEMDGDLSHDPHELPRLIEKLKTKTVVIGSRYIKGSKIVKWSILRRITSRLSNLVIRVLFNMKINDNTNGYRCYSRPAVNVLLNHPFKSKGYVVLTESSYVLFKNGYNFIEVPTIFVNRKSGESKATILEFFNSLLNIINIYNSKG